MAWSDDRLSKPKTGRYFAYPAQEFISRVIELSFSLFHGDPPNKRVAVFMQNCDVECPLGFQLSSFYRRCYVAQFSLPEVVPAAVACKAIDVTLVRFREIDASPDLSLRDEQFVVYRAYLRPRWTLSIAQHVVSAGSRSYLQYRAASQLSKASSNPKSQHVLSELEIT